MTVTRIARTEPGLHPVPTHYFVPLTIPQLTERFERLFSAWQRAGKELYLVGGCVRDVVMGLEEVGDIDLTTDALPEETHEILLQNRLPAYPIGARFGTISTIVDGTQVEITTFRVDETYEARNRKPEVVFGTSLVDDLSRRDLSMNAMAAGPGGRLIDPFDGQRAIRERILEVPGGGLEATRSILRDDPLRLLRVARFAARFGFSPSGDTTTAAHETAGELVHISHERWKMELDKLLVAPCVKAGLDWLVDIGALGVLIHSFDADSAPLMTANALKPQLSSAICALPSHLGPRWAALSILGLCAANMKSAGPLIASLPPDCEARRSWANELAERFRFSNDEKRQHRRFVSELPSPDAINALQTRSGRRRWLALWQDDALDALELALALYGEDTVANATSLRELLASAIEQEDVDVQLPSGFGSKVIRHFGLARGPEIAAAIQHLKDAIIDARVDNGASAESYLQWLSEHESAWRNGN